MTLYVLRLLAVSLVCCGFVKTVNAEALGDTPPRADRKPRVIEVPDEFPSIQQAVDAAGDGDTVRIAPGVYHEQVRISKKSVHLTSWFETTNDRTYIGRTVIDGSIRPDPDPEDDIDPVREYGILVEPDAGPQTTILGLTIRDNDDGIACHARIRILFNRFVNNVDAIDYEDGGGLCRHNTFVANDDDGVDIDNSSEVTVVDNEIRDNDDDGIEIRFHEYRGKPLRIVVRNNRITGNGEDGIQIIGYPETSDRIVVIERNVIAENAMAGIGLMSNANSLEDYEGAPFEERIVIANNTICENQYGITGGRNSLVMNNLLTGNQFASLKNVSGKSVILSNLCWQNGQEPIGSNLGDGAVINANPQLSKTYQLSSSSPAVNAGVVRFDLQETAQIAVPETFSGRAPDLGAVESE